MNTIILSKMKNEEFLEFGNSSMAFVKKENHENDSVESDVFSVYCADAVSYTHLTLPTKRIV